MLQVTQRARRNFDDIESAETIFDILKEKFRDRRLYVRYSIEKTEIKIAEFLDDKTIIVATDPTFKPDQKFSIYGLSDKYIEVELEILEERGPGYYHCSITFGRRAVQGRRDIRFKINPDEAVATNFKVSKHTIDVSGYKIPTSIKVVLEQFQVSNSKMSDIVKVNVFSTVDKNLLLDSIKKTSKALYIEDAAEPESYRAMTDDFIDLHELLGSELDAYIKQNIQKGYKSLVIVPIIYITEDERSIPFGYIQLISKSENFSIEKVLELKMLSFKLVDRIRDANTILITVNQKIVDISRGGAKLLINDAELRKSILKSRGFIFDIVFKLQAPITIYGEVKVTYSLENELYVGVDFEGNSYRKDEMKRFYSIIKPLESDYKAKLIKSLKGRKK